MKSFSRYSKGQPSWEPHREDTLELDPKSGLEAERVVSGRWESREQAPSSCFSLSLLSPTIRLADLPLSPFLLSLFWPHCLPFPFLYLSPLSTPIPSSFLHPPTSWPLPAFSSLHLILPLLPAESEQRQSWGSQINLRPIHSAPKEIKGRPAMYRPDSQIVV